MALSRIVHEPIVWLGNQIYRGMKCARVSRSVGSGRLDTAELMVDLSQPANGYGGRGDVLHNVAFYQEFVGQPVAIERRNASGRNEIIHWGQITEIRPRVGDSLEISVLSRLEAYHFGDPLLGTVVRERRPNGRIEAMLLDGPLVFNPEYDGARQPNMSQFRHPLGFRYMFDVDSSRTEASRNWRGEEWPLLWTVAEAVLYLMWTRNPREQFIRNWRGSARALDQYFGQQEIYNLTLPQGEFLPKLLDSVLTPHGFGWFIEHQGRNQRNIAFMRLGDRTALQLPIAIQQTGQDLNLAVTNCENLEPSFEVARNLVNSVTVLGDYLYIEAAFELQKSWSDDYDELTDADLTVGTEEWESHPEYWDVWRKWVLNEDGSYNGLRPEIKRPYNFSSLFSDPVMRSVFGNDVPISARRRRFLPCLATNDDGTPIGPFAGIRVQWHNGDDWQEFQPGEVSVGILDRECGIYFEDTQVFLPVKIGGTAARLRVVATIRIDRRVGYTAVPANSPNPALVKKLIDAGERFHFRRIDKSSPHYAQVFQRPPNPSRGQPEPADGTARRPLKSTMVDDRLKMKALAEKMLATWNRADCTGQLKLTGTDYGHIQLGNCVPRIGGRNLSLQLDASGTRVPVVVAITYDFREQATTLTLDAPSQEVQF